MYFVGNTTFMYRCGKPTLNEIIRKILAQNEYSIVCFQINKKKCIVLLTNEKSKEMDFLGDFLLDIKI